MTINDKLEQKVRDEIGFGDEKTHDEFIAELERLSTKGKATQTACKLTKAIYEAFDVTPSPFAE